MQRFTIYGQLRVRFEYAELKRSAMVTFIAICALTCACSTPSKPVAEAPVPAPTAQAEQAMQASKLRPAEPHEIEEAVKRVFKESVIMDTNRKPAFVTGDYNGDLSEDLAVVLKPNAAKLSDLNQEYPAWILRDLAGASESKSPRLAVAAEEELLAVIHGYGANGWRDREATQTFLLKNAAGSNLQTQLARNVIESNRGRKLPALGGDVVAEVLDGRPGYLYYRNATYAWYDPKTFTGEPEPRRVHGDQARRMK